MDRSGLEITSMKINSNQQGFTIIEMVIAMTLSVVITSAIYQIFHSQQRSYLVQNQVAEMQQNLRAALYMMAREIRSARYDPTLSGNFGFVTDFASPNEIFSPDIDYAATNRSVIAFTMDAGAFNGNVDANRNEMIAYRLNNNLLQRYNVEAALWETVAADIDALDFVLVDDAGAVTIDPTNVAAVEITLLVRTGEKDKSYKSTQTYLNQRNQNICPSCSSDNYRRRVLTTTVNVRN
jgi:type IV pilus assembly protein PilW